MNLIFWGNVAIVSMAVAGGWGVMAVVFVRWLWFKLSKEPMEHKKA